MNLPENLILKQIELGPLKNFLYFIGDKRTNEVAIIDPAWDVDFLCKTADEEGFKITNVFLTHGHPDHVNGLDEMLERHDVPVYISKHEADYYMPNHKNIVKIDNPSKLKIGDIEFDCILTPGHTQGCQCFIFENVAIAGDAIFIDGCGRCDLPGGDAKVMYHSLYNIIMKWPDETILYTGHNYGPTSFATVGEQKETNPYLNCSNLNDFLQHRMGIST